MGQPKLLDTMTIRRFVNANRSIIYGTLMGDSYIMSRGSGSAMRILHAEDQKALVMHKYDLFREVAPTAPRSFPHTKWGQPKWYFWTACDTEWQRVWSVFHQNCVPRIVNGRKYHYKVVTPQILSEIDDRGMALWIMDDGSYAYGHQEMNPEKPMRSFRLHTEGYTLDENNLIADWLKSKYDVDATVLSSKKCLKDGTPVEYWFIRIGWREFEKIAKRVEPYVIPEMAFKIGHAPSQDKGQLAAAS